MSTATCKLQQAARVSALAKFHWSRHTSNPPASTQLHSLLKHHVPAQALNDHPTHSPWCQRCLPPTTCACACGGCCSSLGTGQLGGTGCPAARVPAAGVPVAGALAVNSAAKLTCAVFLIAECRLWSVDRGCAAGLCALCCLDVDMGVADRRMALLLTGPGGLVPRNPGLHMDD
jgi:hypothetical protein